MHFVVLLSALVACAAGVPANFTNPRISSRIVGGTEADDYEIPYQVSLQKSSESHVCGGVIISKNLVLTALHCVRDHVITKVRAGSRNWYTNGTFHRVEGTITPPVLLPVGKILDPDIVILQVTPDFDFTNPGVKPVMLEDSDVPVGTDAIVSGWGYTKEGDGLPSDTLLKANVRILSDRACRRVHRDSFTERMICARSSCGKQGFCDGDSGGPLVANDRLVGIVSTSRSCASHKYPGVYVKISSVYDWICDILYETDADLICSGQNWDDAQWWEQQ